MRIEPRLSRREFVAGCVGTAVAASGVAAAPTKYPVGVFVARPEGSIELPAYADRLSNGRLKMTRGTLEDIPTVSRIPLAVCNLPNWWLQVAWFTTQQVFVDDLAERRQLTFSERQMSISARATRIAGLDDARAVDRLLEAVGATDANPGYAVLTLGNGGATRDYLVELRPER